MANMKWSSELILDTIQRMWAEGKPLNSAAVFPHAYPNLYMAARRYFGTWDNALLSAGVPIESIKKGNSWRLKAKKVHGNQKWTADAIIAELQSRFAQGQSLATMIILEELSGMYKPMIKQFGSYQKALKAAGIDIKATDYRQTMKWSDEEVTRVLQKNLADGKLTSTYINNGMLRVLVRRYGGWRDALEQLNIPMRAWWTGDRVASAIKVRYESGSSLHPRVVRAEDGLLANAAIRLFGTWEKALAVTFQRVAVAG